ncbi:ABC transporter permease, partial [bacterium]|nr:ABC transporter permease [bacterium]
MALTDMTRSPEPEAGARDIASPARDSTALTGALQLLNFGPLLILALLVVVVALLTPNFLKPGNLGNILAQSAVIAIVALGQQIVILTRGIDLSVGANLALATVAGGLVFRMVDSAPLVVLAMVAAGGAV